MDLERELRLLAAEVAWPPAPDLAARAAREAPRGDAAWRRDLVIAVAVLVIALAAAFAVPESRGAILRFLHLGGVTIERVEQLPPAQERPLGADLGLVVTPSQARQALHAPPLLPPVAPPPQLHLESGAFLSMLFVYHGEPVLLSELGTSAEGVYKKLVGGATRIEFVDVEGSRGVWLAGAPHVFSFPRVPPRLAGNVLIWQRDGLTLRLEGRRLTLPDALVVAHSLQQAKM